MALRNETVLDTRIDTIVYSTGGSAIFTHFTQAGEIFDENAGTWGRNVASLRAAGTDALAATVTFCRAHHLDVFWVTAPWCGAVHAGRRNPLNWPSTQRVSGSSRGGFCLPARPRLSSTRKQEGAP